MEHDATTGGPGEVVGFEVLGVEAVDVGIFVVNGAAEEAHAAISEIIIAEAVDVVYLEGGIA
jgi:hypothetical protein